MPIYSLTYILPNAERGEGARLLCNQCGSQPSWHQGAADRPVLGASHLCIQSIRLLLDLAERAITPFCESGHRDDEPRHPSRKISQIYELNFIELCPMDSARS